MSAAIPSRVLVLGGYGLIGAHVARSLADRGHEVIALGRDPAAARRVLPGFTWVFRDLRDLTRPADWLPLLDDVDAVVNCAGALQDNAKDDLALVHLHAIGALVLACERAGVAIVQISAVGAEPDAPLPFFRTKAEGDALIRESRADWWIFRPGLVIAPSSYGGTALIRALAGIPWVQPVALPNAPLQTVAVQDVAEAVARALEGDTPPGTEADLVEEAAHPLIDIIAATRRWLGFAPARFTRAVPPWAVRLTARFADGLSRLGWRSPLRSTTIAAIQLGVIGRPDQTRRALGRPAIPLDQTFRAIPARAEDRLFARVQLLWPLVLFALALSWVWKGVAGIFAMQRLTEIVVASSGVSPLLARVVIGVLAVVAIALGLSMLVRRWAVRTLVLSAFVTLFYGAALTVLLPAFWFDPFGAGANLALVLVTALTARVMIDTR